MNKNREEGKKPSRIRTGFRVLGWTLDTTASVVRGTVKKGLWVALVLGLLATNIATVSVTAAAGALSRLFEGMTGFGSVLGAAHDGLTVAKGRATALEAELATAKTDNSKLQSELDAAKRRTVDLDTKLRTTSTRNAKLLDEVAVLKRDRLVTYRGDRLLVQHAVGDTSGRIARRTATGATRTVSVLLFDGNLEDLSKNLGRDPLGLIKTLVDDVEERLLQITAG